jgi:hypothetical protein
MASGRGMGDSSKITGSSMRGTGVKTSLMVKGASGTLQNQVKKNAMCSLEPSKCPREKKLAHSLNQKAESCTMAPGRLTT